MKIYCSGPISSNTNYQHFYLEIIKHVNSLNHIAFSQLNNDFHTPDDITDSEIFMRDINWINHSKLLIAEVSGSSTGVGYEISYTLYQKKIPVLALAHINVKRVTAMLTGCDNELLTLKRYTDRNELKNIITNFISTYNKN
ncbi:MAG: hypothetical protein IIC75_02700 [Bacteroidetes bacterium]|nr:hypothetical protein [Bacteroidota bacterium]